MAGFIQVGKCASWSSANWVYRGLMDCLIEEFRDSHTHARVVQKAKWMQSLNLDSLRARTPELANDIEKALIKVTRDIVERISRCYVNSQEADEKTGQQFINEVRTLREMLLAERRLERKEKGDEGH